MLTREKASKITEIKKRVASMLEERQSRQGNPKESLPSSYWSDFCAYFDYMLVLPEEAFDKLRIHTYHLTGDNYQRYYFGMAETILSFDYLKKLAAAVPPEYRLEEPEGGIGHVYPDGRFMSMDAARYQEAVNALYRSGLLPSLKAPRTDRNFILEIGGGYGGLAHHLSRILAPVTYVLVDLPETLLFSASYLSILNPEKKLYLYSPEDFEALHPENADSLDFIFIPNYRLDALSGLKFKLAVNMVSFQEMRSEQVEKYLDFIARHAEVLYSYNQIRNGFNHELVNLTEMLKQRFKLREIVSLENKTLKSGLKLLRNRLQNFLDKRRKIAELRYREYFCEPLQPAHGEPHVKGIRRENGVPS